MVRVLKIEQTGNRVSRREMQFSDAMWEEIRKLNMGGVTWELLPTKLPEPKIPPVEIPKVIVPPVEIPKPPEPPVVPEILLHEAVIPAKEEIVPVKKPKKEKNETSTVQKKRATHKRSKGNAKK